MKLNTRILMIASAVVMGVAGVLAEFVPHEVLGYLGLQTTGMSALMMQVMGGLYLGFAMMNWMAKGVLIGGIYARPLAIGNLVHFLVGALALLKFAYSSEAATIIWVMAGVYSLFAIAFGIVFMKHPSKATTSK